MDFYFVELYTAFRIGKDCMFLFPWADGGSLTDLWKRDPSKEFSQKARRVSSFSDKGSGKRQASSEVFIKWITRECQGLAEALHRLHNTEGKMLSVSDRRASAVELDIYGFHGDIKPENILYFKNEPDDMGFGRLKISDLGLTRFHRETSRIEPVGLGPATQTYASPEYDRTEAQISSWVDVWALGCVFSEFCTWIIKGEESPAKYYKFRCSKESRLPDGRLIVGIRGPHFYSNVLEQGDSLRTESPPESRGTALVRALTSVVRLLIPGDGWKHRYYVQQGAAVANSRPILKPEVETVSVVISNDTSSCGKLI